MTTKKINANALEWTESTYGHFSSFRKQLGALSGGKMLGTSLYKLLPGKKAFPYHFHHANEEAIFVLTGQGILRLNNEEITIQPHDYIALLRGTDHAHQVINNSTDPLIYLCISTMIEPDVLEYPDSNKIGVMTGSAPGGDKNLRSFKGFYKKASEVSYDEGEK